MSSDGGRLLMDLVAGNIIHGEYGVVANAFSLAGIARSTSIRKKGLFSRLFLGFSGGGGEDVEEDAAELEVTSVDFQPGDDIQRAYFDPDCDS
jgi:hypothetical protein